MRCVCVVCMHSQTHAQPTPLILGHEGVGEVVALGRNNTKRALKLGDRVTWTIADSCGHCVPCTQLSMPQYVRSFIVLFCLLLLDGSCLSLFMFVRSKCKSLFKYGHARINDGCGLNGTYSTHVLLRAGTHVVKLPDHVTDRLAAPANCALATVCCLVFIVLFVCLLCCRLRVCLALYIGM